MKISSTIDENLWQAIKNSYDNYQYTDSIKNAVIYLSDYIRDKSGLESDGANLVNQAFSPKNPKIKVNKLQTQTDISIQEGVLQFLSGIYKFIRNPRNHEKYNDTIEEANDIIITINYILKIIKNSQSNFEVNYFIKNRIFDYRFVNSDRYIELLVKEIPSNKRLLIINELLFKFYLNYHTYNAQKVIYAIIDKLSVEQINELTENISKELATGNNNTTIKRIIKTVPIKIINNVDEIAKYRYQNSILNDIKNNNNQLGSCLKYLDNNFILKEELFNTVNDLINKDDTTSISYLFDYILPYLPKIDDINKHPYLVTTINFKLQDNDKNYYKLINTWKKIYKDFINPFKDAIS